MTEPTIICPKCKTEIKLTESATAARKDKLEARSGLKSLEAERNRKRRELFDAQDAIDAQRDELIKRIEGQLRQRHMIKPLFAFRWRLAWVTPHWIQSFVSTRLFFS